MSEDMPTKSVSVRISVQLRRKVVELDLGPYTLSAIYNVLLDYEHGTEYQVARALMLALGYTVKVEQQLRHKARFAGRSFGEALWEWLTGRLEELA